MLNLTISDVTYVGRFILGSSAGLAKRHKVAKEQINFDTDILVIDDDDQIRSFIRIILMKMGFSRVDTASSAQQVIDRIRHKRYGLMFLDINLPGVDGLSLLRLLRDKHPQVKVIMCSANSTSQNVKEAISTGAVGFLAKPVVANNIMKTFDKLGVKYIG